MIGYSLYRVMQRICHRVVSNGYLMLRLLFGFTLMFLSLTLIACAQQTRVDPRYTDTNLKRLSYMVGDGYRAQYTALDPEDMQFLREQYPTVSFEPIGVCNLSIVTEDSMGWARGLICSPSLLSQMGEATPLDAEMTSIISYGVTVGVVSDEMKDFLNQAIRDGQVYELDPSAMASNMLELKYTETSYEDQVFLFLCEPAWYDSQVSGVSVSSYAQFPEMEAREKLQTIAAIHHALSLRHPESRVEIFDSDEKVQLSIKKSESKGEQLSRYAMLLLVVVLVGILGSYLIVCDNRMREFGILLDMGVTRPALALELVLENMFLFGLSALLSCLVGSLCVGLFEYPGMVVRVQPGVFGIVFLLSMLLSAGMAVVGIFKLGHASSVCIKRGE